MTPLTKPLTKQETFDKMVTHMLGMTEKSTLGPDNIVCAYRGMNNAKCAVGCLIDDEYYSVKIEHHSISRIDDTPTSLLVALSSSGIDTADEDILRLMSSVQLVHDDSDIADWQLNLTHLASLEGIKMPEVPA